MASDTIHVIKPGQVEGDKVRLGEMAWMPVDPENPDGPKRMEMKLGRVLLKLGNGLAVVGGGPGMVSLSVTAEAAKRLGWPHPANEKREITAADLPRLQGIVANQEYGQNERVTALRQIAEVNPALGQSLALAYAWLLTEAV